MPLLYLLLSYLSALVAAPAPRATVYVFLADTCPISQAATLPLRELHGQYAAQGIRFVGVFPAADATPGALAAFGKTYQIPFPLQADAGHRLTKKLHARVTPEAVVLAADGKTTLYQGRLNDAYAGLGQHRPVTRHHELADALADVVASRPVAVPRTEPVGCFIEY
ncbi:redoxin domain-containing protein [Hymenobacter convexus]|uniref:redoxin domain-containing protein n=1 Tax=Hymenobacter sp. CA1UV-4 TaxID=3063782 RepID=UPI0027132471|nr:redoxin domain-containing protein [Hymenobacter sp. CA1UV-4]MDO7853113.1 redoxin family protein [Hymenobacter sp. CA1UV-4]